MIVRYSKQHMAGLYLLLLTVASSVCAHEPTATYIANESILVTNGDVKVLFDPFFHKNYGRYQLVPEQTLKKMFAAQTPFDGIDAIVISHAHGDHFAADDVLRYLRMYPKTHLIAPQQAMDELLTLFTTDSNPNFNPDQITKQLHSINLDYNQAPQHLAIDNLVFEAVRIPHAGWPGRAEVENLVFRVTLLNANDHPITVMHMGDADANDDHYLPFKAHWEKQQTDMAFPPYWFFSSSEGEYILEKLINAKEHVGVHVPVQIPERLIETGKDYFSQPGEERVISTGHSHK